MSTQINKSEVFTEYAYQLALTRQSEFNEKDMLRSLSKAVRYLKQHHIKGYSLISKIKANLILSSEDDETIKHIMDYWHIYREDEYTYEAIANIIVRAKPAKSLTPKRTAALIKKIIKTAA